MKFSFNVKKTVTAKVQCAACKERFPAPPAAEDGTLSGECPHCGHHFSFKVDGKYRHLFPAKADKQTVPPSAYPSGRLIEATPAARSKARWINNLTIILVLWALFFPMPYLPVMAALIILPLVLPLLIAPDRGAIQVIDYPKTAGPNVAIAFLALPMALVFRAITDFNLLSYGPLLEFTLALAAISFALYVRFAMVSDRGIGQYLIIMPFLLVFGFASAIVLNCTMDGSPGEGYAATVMDKRVSKGRKANTYYLSLSEWGDRTSGAELNVPGKVFRAVEKNNRVAIEVKRGFLNARWYTIQKE